MAIFLDEKKKFKFFLSFFNIKYCKLQYYLYFSLLKITGFANINKTLNKIIFFGQKEKIHIFTPYENNITKNSFFCRFII